MNTMKMKITFIWYKNCVKEEKYKLEKKLLNYSI